MNRKATVSIITLLLLTTLACTGGGLIDPPDPLGPPLVRTVNIEIANQSIYDICYVLISASDSEDWGADWLGDEEVIAAGGSKTFPVDAGTYDVKVVTCKETTLATFWDISRDTTLTVGGQNLVAVGLVNESAAEICYVFISSSGNDDWGEDWLGKSESILAQGGKRAFFVQPGAYDLLAQDCEGNDIATTKAEIAAEFIWRVQ